MIPRISILCILFIFLILFYISVLPLTVLPVFLYRMHWTRALLYYVFSVCISLIVCILCALYLTLRLSYVYPLLYP